ncbi:excinuclease ABC subunit UvrA [Nocardia sp. NPDC057030]|uniref:excinuclease ABC subunit UvrA n=1 Tax=unclassified Nocardia TaxID=2637762 RepID=UPI003644768F
MNPVVRDPLCILVQGARENNLRSVTVAIPRNELTVITGVSGSGKSSLAFGTVYAEGQRQYQESLSPYQRRGFDRIPKPKVDTITGLGPTVAVKQHVAGRNPRSTVGTITEAGDFVRVLFARAGVHTCGGCGADVLSRTTDELLEQALAAVRGGPARSGLVPRWLLPVDDGIAPLDDSYAVEVVRDQGGRESADAIRHRVAALRTRPDAVLVVEPDGASPLYLATGQLCAHCGRTATAVSPRHFSPNTPDGMCRGCEGLGTRIAVSVDKMVADPHASIRAGALAFYGDRRGDPKKTYWPVRDVPDVLAHFGFTLDTPWNTLPSALRDIILHGETPRSLSADTAAFLSGRAESGLLPELDRLFRAASDDGKKRYHRFMSAEPCTECGGTRLNAAARAVRLGGLDITEVQARPIAELAQWLDTVQKQDLSALVVEAVDEIVRELRRRLFHICEVGLEYLALDRQMPALSAGEGQRLRIARQLGCGLVGVVYVLDEPSVGLHPRDTRKLIESLRRLREAGNTVIVVEHDAEVMRSADHLIDIGPGAGTAGGRLVAAGSPDEVMARSSSPTARYLRGEFVPGSERTDRRVPDPAAQLHLTGARLHNLRDIDVAIPVDLFTCVTGPSGSGKSSLVKGILEPAVAAAIKGEPAPGGVLDRLGGHEVFGRVIGAAQDPMGRSSRSIPATYIGVFDEIRRLFARLPLSVEQRWNIAHFSFNAESGQCLSCRGSGELSMALHFLSDVVVPCSVCAGRRYNADVLAARLDGLSIADVLDLEVSRAVGFFAERPKIVRALRMLDEVGLGHLRLGQSCATLSGGEAQRLKLSRELLHDTDTTRTLYIVDEPTSGLHAADVSLLIDLLHRLVDRGDTVVVIEHNVDVIAAADWVIDLGPGGGADGGLLVAQGTPEALADHPHSALAPFLRQALAGSAAARAPIRHDGAAPVS